MDWTQYLENLRNPPATYRAKPFHAWNAVLDKEELCRQVEVMKEMGMGGFFMHSRVGLGTPYLAQPWFDCINACTDKAASLGMTAWLYDEDRWPSGSGGGFATKELRFRRRCLIAWPEGKPDEPRVNEFNYVYGYYAVAFTDGFDSKMKSARRLTSADDPRSAGEILCTVYHCIDQESTWYNGNGYLDVMNPDAVHEFIRVTHKAYLKNCGEKFEKCIPGIFGDEPNFDTICRGAIPWTDRIPELFQKKFGYDILDFLPEVFWEKDGDNFSKPRLDWFNLATQLFAESYNGEIGKWCREHNLVYTAHMLCEDTLSRQTPMGGCVMRHYEHMEQPGIDQLGGIWFMFNTVKQCTSVAHQFGRERRMTETIGCTGWDFPFYGHKALLDFQMALGMNFRVPHLSWYSMAGEAKRDYPASILHQSPWYHHYRDVEDVLARITAAVTPGEEVRELLVIHPIESHWAVHSLSIKQTYGEEDDAFDQLSYALLGAHLDFDFGDEDIMSRHGGVCKKSLKVGVASYRAVLIPEMRTVRKSTLDLLSAFAGQGGFVAYLGEPPKHMDGLVSGEPAKQYQKFISATRQNMVNLLEKHIRRFSVSDESGSEISPVLSLLKQQDDTLVLYLANTGTYYEKHPQRAQLCVRDRNLAFMNAKVQLYSMKREFSVYELNLCDGNLEKIDFCHQDGTITFRTDFRKLESRIFVVTTKQLDVPKKQKAKDCVSKITFPLSGCRCKFDDPNVLVLDQFEFSVDGEPFQKDYVLNIDNALRKRLSVPQRTCAMIQPWLSLKHAMPEKTAQVTLRACFRVDEMPPAVELAMEHPELYAISLNGKSIANADCGWWVDKCLRRISLPIVALQRGENMLELKTDFHRYHPGLEAMFLLGHFGVTNRALTALKNDFEIGDLGQQGLPHYAGNVLYQTALNIKKDKDTRYILHFGEWRGVSLAVRVNGGVRIPIPFPPFETDLTPYLKDGENTFEFEVLGSRRNAFGPFYNDEENPFMVGGPPCFYAFKQPEKRLVPFGLLSAPELWLCR